MWSCFTCCGDDAMLKRHLRVAFEKIRAYNRDVVGERMFVDRMVIHKHLPGGSKAAESCRREMEHWVTPELDESEFVERFGFKTARNAFQFDDDFQRWVWTLPVGCEDGTVQTLEDAGRPPEPEADTAHLLEHMDVLRKMQEEDKKERDALEQRQQEQKQEYERRIGEYEKKMEEQRLEMQRLAEERKRSWEGEMKGLQAELEETRARETELAQTLNESEIAHNQAEYKLTEAEARRQQQEQELEQAREKEEEADKMKELAAQDNAAAEAAQKALETQNSELQKLQQQLKQERESWEQQLATVQQEQDNLQALAAKRREEAAAAQLALALEKEQHGKEMRRQEMELRRQQERELKDAVQEQEEQLRRLEQQAKQAASAEQQAAERLIEQDEASRQAGDRAAEMRAKAAIWEAQYRTEVAKRKEQEALHTQNIEKHAAAMAAAEERRADLERRAEEARKAKAKVEKQLQKQRKAERERRSEEAKEAEDENKRLEAEARMLRAMDGADGEDSNLGIYTRADRERTDLHHMPPQEFDKLKSIYDSIDENRNGSVSFVELMEHFENVSKYRDSDLPPSFSDEKGNLLFKRMAGGVQSTFYDKQKIKLLKSLNVDADGDDKITFREFTWWYCAEYDLWVPSYKVFTDETLVCEILSWCTQSDQQNSHPLYPFRTLGRCAMVNRLFNKIASSDSAWMGIYCKAFGDYEQAARRVRKSGTSWKEQATLVQALKTSLKTAFELKVWTPEPLFQGWQNQGGARIDSGTEQLQSANQIVLKALQTTDGGSAIWRTHDQDTLGEICDTQSLHTGQIVGVVLLDNRIVVASTDRVAVWGIDGKVINKSLFEDQGPTFRNGKRLISDPEYSCLYCWPQRRDYVISGGSHGQVLVWNMDNADNKLARVLYCSETAREASNGILELCATRDALNRDVLAAICGNAQTGVGEKVALVGSCSVDCCCQVIVWKCVEFNGMEEFERTAAKKRKKKKHGGMPRVSCCN